MIYIYIRILAVCLLSHLGCNIRFPIAHWLSPRGEEALWRPQNMTSTFYLILPRTNIQPLFYVILSIKKCIHVHIVINPPKQKIQLLKEIYYRYLGYSIRISVLMTCEKFACNNSIQVGTQYKVAVFPLI